MALNYLKARLKNRIDTASNWESANPTLLKGEIGIESDTGYIKAGDGSTAWNDLSYLTAPGLKDDLTGDYLPLSGGTMTGTIVCNMTEDNYDSCIRLTNTTKITSNGNAPLSVTNQSTGDGISVTNSGGSSYANGIWVENTGNGSGVSGIYVQNNHSNGGVGINVSHINKGNGISISMGNNATGDALNITSKDSTKSLIFTQGGYVNFQNSAYVTVPTPTASMHATTKTYVDNAIEEALNAPANDMSSVDLNTYTATGNYFVSSSSSLTNAPSVNSASALQNVFLNVVAYNTSNLTQTLTCVPSNKSDTVYRYVRLCAGGIWKDWQQVAPQ